jgi:hypothetical protein
MINFPSPLTGLSGAGAGGMTPAGLGLPPMQQQMSSPETFLGGKTPEPATIMASPLADRMSGLLMQRQQQAVFARVAETIRNGLKLLAQIKQATDPKQSAQIERMAAQLLQMFPPVVVPSSEGQIGGLMQGAPQMPMQGMGSPLPPPSIPPSQGMIGGIP